MKENDSELSSVAVLWAEQMAKEACDLVIPGYLGGCIQIPPGYLNRTDALFWIYRRFAPSTRIQYKSESASESNDPLYLLHRLERDFCGNSQESAAGHSGAFSVFNGDCLQILPIVEGAPKESEGTSLGIQLDCAVWNHDGTEKTPILIFLPESARVHRYCACSNFHSGEE